MALKLDLIGKETDIIPFKYNNDTVILYALGIGAGTEELDFVYEKNLKVYPTFAIVAGGVALDPCWGNLNLNWPMVLHGEQEITLHREIPAAGTLYTVAMVEAIYDKGDNGALIVIVQKTKDDKGNLMFEMRLTLFDRSAGNFGGERGPKSEIHAPAEGASPDFTVTIQTSPDQALLYRLSGDKNPLHADPQFAKKSGLPKPILHGLCTYGIAGRAVLNSVCDDDSSRLKKFGARFLNPVFPGEALTTEGWKAADDKYIIQVKGQDGRLVLGNAYAMIA